MANPFGGFLEFALAVVGHTFTLLAGCMVTVVIGFFEKRILKRDISLRLEVAVVCAFLFFACFQAWRDDHVALTTLENKLRTPEFGGELDAVVTGTHMSDSSKSNGIPVVFVTGIITNPFGPSCALLGWKMGIEIPGSQIVWGKSLILSEKDQRGPIGHTGQSLRFRNEDYWPIKTVQPVAAGGAVEGWLWSTFRDVNFDEAFKKHATVIIEFRDVVTNKSHRMTKVLTEKGIHER